MEKRNDEGVLQWFYPVERLENDRIAMRVYVVDSGRGGLIPLTTEKKGLNIEQTRI